MIQTVFTTLAACFIAAATPPDPTMQGVLDGPRLMQHIVDHRHSAEARAAAARALLAAPDTDLPALLDTLVSEIALANDKNVVAAFARVLARSEQQTVEAFFRFGFSDNVFARRNCTLAIRFIVTWPANHPREWASLLLWYALDPDDAVRADAACALGPFLQMPAVTVELLRLSRDSVTAVRAAAVETLAIHNSDVVAVQSRLLEALDDPAPLVRAAAIRSVWQVKGRREDAMRVLTSEIENSAAVVRQAVLVTLDDKLDRDATPSLMNSGVAILVRGLSDSDESVRTAAARCASDSVWDGHSRTILPLLLPLVQEPSEDLRECVVYALSRYIEDYPKALAAMRSRLNDESTTVRCSAIRELRVVLLKDEGAFRGVLAVLDERDVEARRAAALCLAEAAPQEGRKSLIAELANALLRCADDPDPEVRAIAVSKVTFLAASKDRILQTLDRALQDPAPDVRLAALREIVRGTEGSYRFLAAEAAVRDKDWRVREVAVRIIGGTPDASAAGFLLKAAADPHPVVRCAALHYLARLEPVPSDALGLAILCLEDAETFPNACSLLAAIGPAAQPAVTRLLAIAQEGEPDLRSAAIKALSRICPDSLREISGAAVHVKAADAQAQQSLRKSMLFLAAVAAKSQDSGDFETAVTLLKGAADMAQRLGGDGSREASLYQCHLALLYLQTDRLSQAEQAMRSCSTPADEPTDANLHLSQKCVSAGILLARGQADDAMFLLRPLVEMPVTSFPQDSLVNWQNLMAMFAIACWKAGHVTDAVQALEQVIADRRGDPRGRSQAHFVLGQIHLALGDHDAAELQLTSAINAGLPSSERLEPVLLGLLAQIDVAKGRFSQASSRITESRQAARRRLSEYLHAAPEEDGPLLTLARDAVPFLRTMALVPSFPAAFAEDSATWVLNGKAGVTEELCAAKWRLTEQLTALNTRQETTGDFSHDGASTRSAAGSGHPLTTWLPLRVDRWVTCAEVRDVVPSGSVVVEFAIWPTFDKYGRWVRADFGAWLISRQGERAVECVRLGDYDAVSEAVLQVQECVRRRATDFGESRQKLSALSQLILRPIEEKLGGYRTWILCPDGPLWLVPWAALVLSDGRYVCEGHVVSTVESGRFLLWPSHREEARGMVILADPELAGESRESGPEQRQGMRLPGAEREAKAVAAAMSAVFADKVETFLGDRASVSTLMAIHRPRLLYVATHASVQGVSQSLNKSSYAGRLLDVVGAAETNMPEGPFAPLQPICRTGLYLSAPGEEGVGATDGASSGFVSEREIATLDLRGTELVVVSACDSGFQAATEIDVLDGLRKAFHVAGANNVITSLWPVPDAEAPRLMADVFSNLAAGHEAAEALCLAQVASAQSGVGDLSNPYYWAGWTVSGVPLDIRPQYSAYNEPMHDSVAGRFLDLPRFRGALVSVLVPSLLTLSAVVFFVYRRRRHRSREQSSPSE